MICNILIACCIIVFVNASNETLYNENCNDSTFNTTILKPNETIIAFHFIGDGMAKIIACFEDIDGLFDIALINNHSVIWKQNETKYVSKEIFYINGEYVIIYNPALKTTISVKYGYIIMPNP
jgi:hypothetical protein